MYVEKLKAHLRAVSVLDKPELLAWVFYPRRDYSPAPLGYQDVFVRVEEGVELCCRFYPYSKDAPTILFFHGNGEVASDYDLIAPAYASAGANLFVAEYRGYGLSGGEPTLSSMLWDAHAVYDQLKALLKERGFLKGVFVMGRSLGSAPAIELAYRRRGEFLGLIVESGFASLADLIKLLTPFSPLPPLPKEVEDLNAEKIKSVSEPTLIIHGELDSLIPLEHGKRLYQESGASDKKLEVIGGAGHNDLLLIGREQYFSAIKEFVQAHG